MNQLAVVYSKEDDHDEGLPSYRIIAEVDGEPVGDFVRKSLILDLEALQLSAEKEGEYFIITCSCGQNLCGEIYKGIEVSHNQGQIVWGLYTQPVVAYPPPQQPYLRSEGSKTPVKTFTFERASYLAAIQAGIADGRALLQKQADGEIELVIGNNYRVLQDPSKIHKGEGVLGLLSIFDDLED